MGAHANDGQISSRFRLNAVAAVVAVNAALAWLVATGAVVTSTHWPPAAAVPLGLLFGVLVGAVTRSVAAGRSAIAGRVAVAVAVGAVVGELASVLLFSGSIDRRIDEQAAAGAPVVMQAAADLDRASTQRSSLDTEVEQARARRDEALVVARCEYNPSPACPQTRITGVPGSGPETRTANELLAGAQQELTDALSDRDERAAGMDAAAADAGRQLDSARVTAVADADRGLGARWVAMNGYTLSDAGALLVRLAAIAFFSLLTLLPLVLRLWRGETNTDRVESARTEADAAIAIKQAEVRAAAETLWAEQQLANARFAVAAQTQIDRDHHRRRVAEATGTPVPPGRIEFMEDDMYLPIAAEAEAASRATAELPAVKPADARAPLIPAIPAIPEVTRAAARWIRPLVPPIVTRVIDTATQPVRAARQAFEEVEEITFSFKRVHRVTVDSATVDPGERVAPQPAAVAAMEPGGRRVEASFDRPGAAAGHRLGGPERTSELAGAGRGELRESRGPRALPPGD